MMKTFIASTAITFALAAPGFAQTAPTEAPMSDEFVASIDTEALRASDLIGARLYMSESQVDPEAGQSDDWDDVGEISDIIVGNGGEVDAVLVDIGGFLGIGERTVAVNMDALQFVSDGASADDYFVVLSGTRDELENAPQFNNDFASGRTQAAADMDRRGSGMTSQAGSSLVMPGDDNLPDLDDGTVIDNAKTPAAAVVTDGTVTTTAGDPANVGTDGVATEGTVAPMAEGEADPALAEDGQTGMDATDQTETTTGGMMAAPAMQRDGYETVASGDITTEEIDGATVYGTNDERVGEIGELVMSESGEVQDAVIDFGGFLGLGEKQIAIPFESLQIMRNADEYRVYIDATEEQMESMPEYQG